MKRTMRHFVDNRDKRPMAMGLIADQNPVLRANMHWYIFTPRTSFSREKEAKSKRHAPFGKNLFLPVFGWRGARLRALGIEYCRIPCLASALARAPL